MLEKVNYWNYFQPDGVNLWYLFIYLQGGFSLNSSELLAEGTIVVHIIIIVTRLIERFAPIIYFICKHFELLEYIVKQNKIFAFYKRISYIFKILKIEFLKIWLSINLPWSQARSHKNFGPDRFSRFDVYWIQTDK